MNKTQKAERWAAIRPALVKSWQAWNQLSNLDTDPEGAARIWEAQEQRLFDLAPQLYREWWTGKTPAQRLGEQRTALVDAVCAHCREFGTLATASELIECMGWDIDPRKIKRAARK